jgi:hypothetical protein
VTLYPYDDLINEYEDGEVDRLVAALGCLPSSTLCIELRRSCGGRACDVAEELSVLFLEQFPGVVDDLYSECWTLAEIQRGLEKSSGAFLDCYRPPGERVA